LENIQQNLGLARNKFHPSWMVDTSSDFSGQILHETNSLDVFWSRTVIP